MKTFKVLAIFNQAGLYNLQDKNTVFVSDAHLFYIKTQKKGEVLFVQSFEKGPDGSIDLINDVNNSVIIKTLKELKQRVSA